MKDTGAWLLACLVLASCSAEDSSTKSRSGGTGDAQSSPSGDAQPGDADGGHVGTGDADGALSAARALAVKLGRDKLLIGGYIREDANFATAPFDLRYLYLSGGVPEGGPCDTCTANCDLAWWGCWQYDQVPPGNYVRKFIDEVELANAIPMFTYYVWLSVGGAAEGAPEVDALAVGARVADYLADWRFLLAQIAATTSNPVMVHIEPDLSGYATHAGAPGETPVALDSAGQAECAGEPNNYTGFTRCMLLMARSVAPNVLIGAHASPWAYNHNVHINADSSYDVGDDARTTAQFLIDAGAGTSDFLVVEMGDRDAGFSDRWWDTTDTTLPNFQQAMTWAGAVGDHLGMAHLWWQVPFGHMGLDDTCGRYRDNRVDYVFDHPGRVAEHGAVGVAFGAGAGCMTQPHTDDGHFDSRAAAYFSAGGTPLP